MAEAGGQAESATWKDASPGNDDEEIIPRDIRFGIVDHPQRHWFEGDVVKTAVVDGLSIFLPEGERFFIRSLKHFAPHLPDRHLADEINGYAVQEAFHTREHEDYNRSLVALGYDVEAMERPIRSVLKTVKSPIYRLAVTCAIEHLTATFSTMTLRHDHWMAKAAPAYRRLWMWHALEELEHKAVALDVLKAAMHDVPAWQRYLLRVTAMNGTIIPFFFLFIRNIRLYARADGVKTGVRFWLHFIYVMMIKPGFWRGCAPLLLKYYLPGFDPKNHDDQRLVRKGRAWLYREFSGSPLPAGPAV